MLIPRCVTCGKCLAYYQIDYEKGLKEIENNPNATAEEKNEAQKELIQSFGLKRYCCTARLKSYIPLVERII